MRFSHHFLLLLCAGSTMTAYAQQDRVGVGHRFPTEQLDVKGAVRIQELPRKGSNIHTDATGQYDNTKSAVFTPKQVVVADAHGVLGTASNVKPSFFYMPTIVLPTETTDPAFSTGDGKFHINLYDRYKDQIQLTAMSAATPGAAQSTGATGLPLEAVSDLEFYITYFDTDVFTDVQIDPLGELTYKVVPSPDVTEKTFMNVIFKVKD